MIFGEPTRKQPSKGIKEALFDKQKGKCMYCGRKMTIRYLHVDHKIPLSRGGSDRLSNRQLLCQPCNNRKGNMTDGEFRRMYKLTPTRKAQGPPSNVLSQSFFDSVKRDVDAAKKARKSKSSSWF